MRRALLLMLAVPLVVLAPPASAGTTYTIHIAAEPQYAQCNGGYPIFDPYGNSPKLPVPVTVVFVNDDPRPDCVVAVHLEGFPILNVPGGSSRSATITTAGGYGYASGPHDGYGGGAAASGIVNAVTAPSPSPTAATTAPPSASPASGGHTTSPTPAKATHAPTAASQTSAATTQGATPPPSPSPAVTEPVAASSVSPSGSATQAPAVPLATSKGSAGGSSLLVSVLTGALGAALVLGVGWVIRARRRSPSTPG